MDQGLNRMSNQTLYQERLTRIKHAINLEPVDRIPVVYMGSAFSPRYMGMSIAKYCADPDAAMDVTLAAMQRLGDLDGCNLIPAGRITVILTGQWLSRIAVPGRDLPADSLWQVQEAEMMTVEDYDTIINQGWRAFEASFMPRVIDMAEVRANDKWLMANLAGVYQRFRDNGFVPISGGGTTMPFEFLCGARSMPRFYQDLYRIPNKVKAAMDVMMPDMIQMGLGGARLSGAPGTWVGGWRSASALLAPKLWDKFVFPYLHQIVTALSDNQVLSVLHFDQNWDRDLARLRELPAKKCILNLDSLTDVRKAKEILGDRMAIMGDVPSSLFAMGAPDDIANYVRDLARDVGPTGLILCPGCDAPINTKPENMETFVAAAHTYGVVA
jgi:uroporphyrinogen-III decarboxylase